MTLEAGIIVAIGVIAGIVWFLLGLWISSKIDSFRVAMGVLLLWMVGYIVALFAIIPLVYEEPEVIRECCKHICKCGG